MLDKSEILFTANEEATVHFSACFISAAGKNIKTNITDNLVPTV